MIEKLEPGQKAPFTAHLGELRKRLILCIATLFLFFIAVWPFSAYLLGPFQALLGDRELVFITPTEAFFVHVKVAFYTAAALSLPVLLYQGWAFLSPGLFKKEKKFLFRFVFASTIFFPLGAGFCFFLVLPYGLNFLLAFGGESLMPMLSIASVIGFCLNLMFVFGIVFQLPVLVVFLNLMEIVTVEQFTRFRPYLIVSSFLVSAIITPPDVFTQVVLSLPLIILYELSLILLKVIGKNKKSVEADSDTQPVDRVEE
jgi:sec-independent protein translocase protein TatC